MTGASSRMEASNQSCRLRLRKNPYIHRFAFRRSTGDNRSRTRLERIAALDPTACRYLLIRHEVVRLAIFRIRILASAEFLL